MLTPRQNLAEAHRLLDLAASRLSGSLSASVPADTIALAVARIQLAQVLHMVQLAENVNAVLEDSRPRRYGLADIEPPDHR